MFSLETEAASHIVLQPPGSPHKAAYMTGFWECVHRKKKDPILCDESDLFVLHVAEIQTGGPQTSCWFAEWSGTVGPMEVEWG